MKAPPSGSSDPASAQTRRDWGRSAARPQPHPGAGGGTQCARSGLLASAISAAELLPASALGRGGASASPSSLTGRRTSQSLGRLEGGAGPRCEPGARQPPELQPRVCGTRRPAAVSTVTGAAAPGPPPRRASRASPRLLHLLLTIFFFLHAFFFCSVLSFLRRGRGRRQLGAGRGRPEDAARGCARYARRCCPARA